jgi:hypothetical protein
MQKSFTKIGFWSFWTPWFSPCEPDAIALIPKVLSPTDTLMTFGPKLARQRNSLRAMKKEQCHMGGVTKSALRRLSTPSLIAVFCAALASNAQASPFTFTFAGQNVTVVGEFVNGVPVAVPHFAPFFLATFRRKNDVLDRLPIA